MDIKLNYKVIDDFDLNNLVIYDFYKTQPKSNPWWQCPLTIDWSSGLGFYIESLNINKNTREIFLYMEDNFNANKYKNVISKMLDDGVIEEI